MLLATPAASRAAIWLAGLDPKFRAHLGGGGESDYQNLFTDDAAWARAQKTVGVFKVYMPWLLNGPEDALRQMFADLDRHGIALAMEAPMIPRREACGEVEGYAPPGAIERAALRVKRLGGVLRYVAMDEPLWYGHFDPSPKACRSSMADLAGELAENVRALRAVFPAVTIGDIEPFQGTARNSLKIADVIGFAQAYRSATGIPLAFMHADLSWDQDGAAELAPLKAALHASGIRLGVIYNGRSDEPTDVAWVKDAESHFEEVEQRPDGVPDDAVLQTWMLRPTRMLPETDAGTMTHLALAYGRPVTRLSLSRDGAGVVGRLTDAAGAPVGGQAITLSVIDGATARTVTIRDLGGLVPAGAASGLLALRVNTETGGVGGGQFMLGAARYQEVGDAPLERESPGGVGQPVTVSPGQAVSRNTPPFPVTAGRFFTFEVPMAATAGLRDAGYVALIFQDAGGREIRRFRLPLTPARVSLGQARADGQGRFRVSPAPLAARGVTIAARFDGDDRWRGAEAALN